ncbi:NAD(P)/FAD-dependent oxidoreductase [Celeribacter sp.]|uniref:NAD(P)/FAD-dependent oxidoreductase n=1 Tax=Celeribacter sp. TaxID=1890673 RepID=UPI003A8D46E9
MSFDAVPFPRPRIAIIGSGISGLATAYLLADTHDVTVYESEARLGGHARTVMAGLRGDQPVDTGFIVFNYANYPHLTAMFADLGVPVIPSDMSFGASIDNGRIEYGLNDLSALFGQRRNIARPAFLRMVRDILKFNAKAESRVDDETTTIGELINEMGLGREFRDHYLMPICGAIWSTSVQDISAYPAASLLRFFRNHALLSATGQHQWWTVKGGSIEYVRRLEAHLQAKGVTFHLNAPVKSVSRNGVHVTIHAKDRPADSFDQVVFACHSDQALAMLDFCTPQENHALGNLRYQPNRVILHRDTAQMPKRKACWSSWVYKADTNTQATRLGVTYWMNRLQSIPESDPLFVTLNPAHEVPDEMIYDEATFHHPVFDTAALAAQHEIAAIQGDNRTWFAGAYLRHGFHEDGFHSAVQVANAMKAQINVPMAAE